MSKAAPAEAAYCESEATPNAFYCESKAGSTEAFYCESEANPKADVGESVANSIAEKIASEIC